MTIADLHHTIQAAMGWQDYHLHAFSVRGKEYGIAYDGGQSFADDARQVRLKDFGFRVGERFDYEYDFGDGWEHEIVIEAIGKAEPGKPYPVCTDGERAGPPEDSGGAGRYMEILEILALPRHPEDEEGRNGTAGGKLSFASLRSSRQRSRYEGKLTVFPPLLFIRQLASNSPGARGQSPRMRRTRERSEYHNVGRNMGELLMVEMGSRWANNLEEELGGEPLCLTGYQTTGCFARLFAVGAFLAGGVGGALWGGFRHAPLFCRG